MENDSLENNDEEKNNAKPNDKNMIEEKNNSAQNDIKKENFEKDIEKNLEVNTTEKQLKKADEFDIEKLEKIKDEIDSSKKNKKSNVLEKKRIKKILANVILLILFVIYFVMIKLATKNVSEPEILNNDFRIFAIFELLLVFAFFEVGYKKDNMYIGWFGMEIFAIDCSTLLLGNLYKLHSGNFDRYFSVILMAGTIYYVIKIIWMSIKLAKKQ